MTPFADSIGELSVTGEIMCALKSTDYRNVPKCLNRQVWADSVDPDQTAILSTSLGPIHL